MRRFSPQASIIVFDYIRCLSQSDIVNIYYRTVTTNFAISLLYFLLPNRGSDTQPSFPGLSYSRSLVDFLEETYNLVATELYEILPTSSPAFRICVYYCILCSLYCEVILHYLFFKPVLNRRSLMPDHVLYKLVACIVDSCYLYCICCRRL